MAIDLDVGAARVAAVDRFRAAAKAVDAARDDYRQAEDTSLAADAALERASEAIRVARAEFNQAHEALVVSVLGRKLGEVA